MTPETEILTEQTDEPTNDTEATNSHEENVADANTSEPATETPKRPASVETHVREAFSKLGKTSAPEGQGSDTAKDKKGGETKPTLSGDRGTTDKSAAREALFGKGKKAPQAQQKTPQPGVTPDAQPEINPPQRLTAAQKEAFHTLPYEQKKILADTVRDLEAGNMKVVQESRRVQAAAQEALDAIQPYVNKWNIKGLSPGMAIRQLAAVNDYLMEHREDGLLQLAATMRLDPNKIIAKLTGKEGASNGNGHAQLPEHLTNELREAREFRQRMQSHFEAQQAAEIDRVATEISSQIESVRNERNAAGKFKYPLLHDGAFLSRVQPLIGALKEAHPDLSWGDCAKRAYISIEGGSLSPDAPRPTNGIDAAEEIQRAKVASTSLRGKGGAPVATQAPKSPKKVEDTVRLAYEMSARGKE